MKANVNAGLKWAAGGVIAGTALYTLVIRPWHLRWGATDEELKMALPGDDVVLEPNTNSTRALTIDADPEDVWPWIVQMGKGRGGLYSYDWLDIAFRYLDEPSSEVILPEFQELKAGDLIPLGPDDGPGDDFYVHYAEHDHALVIGANDPSMRDKVTWAIVLRRIGENRTRLIMRVRGRIEMTVKGAILAAMLDPAAFIMLRKQMLNFKRLAERTRADRTASLRKRTPVGV